jgi:glycosyltransferase involved in cell wall biosynthesis
VGSGSQPRSANVCYVVPENRATTIQHFAHVPHLLGELAKHARVAALVERGDPIEVAGVEPVITMRYGATHGVRRVLEYVSAARRLKAAGFDTYFLRYSRIAALVLIATRPLFRHRIVYWSSGQADMLADGQRVTMRRRFDHWLNRFVLRRADKVVTGPESMVTYMTERWKLRPGHVSLLYNDIDTDRFAPVDPTERAALRTRLGIGAEEWCVLVVQRLAYRRGTRLLVPIVEQLVKDGHTPLRLFVIGTGDEDEVLLERAVAESFAGDHITLLGPLPNAQTPDWYRAADAFLMPSYEEGFARVLLEAMAAATPIVTTRAGGSADVVGASYPYIVEIGDRDGMVDALERLAACDHAELEGLGEDLRIRACARFSTPQVAAMLAEQLA